MSCLYFEIRFPYSLPDSINMLQLNGSAVNDVQYAYLIGFLFLLVS